MDIIQKKWWLKWWNHYIMLYIYIHCMDIIQKMMDGWWLNGFKWLFKLTPTLLVPDLLVLFVAPERRGQNAHVTCDRSLENATFRNLSAFHQIVRLSQHYARFKAVAKFTTLSAFDNSASNVSHTHWMVGYRHVFFILCFIDTLEMDTMHYYATNVFSHTHAKNHGRDARVIFSPFARHFDHGSDDGVLRRHGQGLQRLQSRAGRDCWRWGDAEPDQGKYCRTPIINHD